MREWVRDRREGRKFFMWKGTVVEMSERWGKKNLKEQEEQKVEKIGKKCENFLLFFFFVLFVLWASWVRWINVEVFCQFGIIMLKLAATVWVNFKFEEVFWLSYWEFMKN